MTRRTTAIAIFASLMASSVGASPKDALWDSSWGNGLLEEEVQAPPPAKKNNNKRVGPIKSKGTPEEDEDEPWRKKDDWWKDPLAMFDENDEYIENDDETSTNSREEKEIAELEAAEAVKEAADAVREAVEAKAAQEKQQAKEKEAREKEQAKKRAEAQKVALQKATEEAATKEKETEERSVLAKEISLKASMEKAAMEKAALGKAAEIAAAKERAAKARAAEKEAAKERRKEEKAASQLARQERKAQKEYDREFEKALKAASQPSTKRKGPFGMSPSKFALPIPALKAGLSKMPFLSSPGPALGLCASVVVVKVLFDKLRRKSSQELASEELLQNLDDYPPALAKSRDDLQFELDELRYSDAYSDEQTDTSDSIDIDSDVDSAPPNSFEQEKIAKIGTTSSGAPNNPSSPALFKGLRAALVGGHSGSVGNAVAVSGGRRVKVTANELDYLKNVADRAVTERQAMEQEYEKTSFQLQEAQTEVTQLASTTKYLKSQLKDYEEMMDRTIRNERKRSKAEIYKMKATMEAAIEQDRESLRKQFTRELERLQSQYEEERAQQQHEEAVQSTGEWEDEDGPLLPREDEGMQDSSSTNNKTLTNTSGAQQQRNSSTTTTNRRNRRNKQ